MILCVSSDASHFLTALFSIFCDTSKLDTIAASVITDNWDFLSAAMDPQNPNNVPPCEFVSLFLWFDGGVPCGTVEVEGDDKEGRNNGKIHLIRFRPDTIM